MCALNTTYALKIFKWKKFFGGSTAKTNTETEAAKEVVKRATTYRYTFSNDFTEVVGGYYQKLDELLQARKNMISMMRSDS